MPCQTLISSNAKKYVISINKFWFRYAGSARDPYNKGEIYQPETVQDCEITPSVSDLLPVLEMKLRFYWSESISWIYFYIGLNKNWKIYWSEQCFNCIGPEDRCSSCGMCNNTSNKTELETSDNMLDLAWCIKYLTKMKSSLTTTDWCHPWDNHGTYIICLKLFHYTYLLDSTKTVHCVESIGWQIEGCGLLYQILIYETFK